jgi:hypothetical protein
MVSEVSAPDPVVTRLDKVPAPKSVSEVSVKEEEVVDRLILPDMTALSVESLEEYLVQPVWFVGCAAVSELCPPVQSVCKKEKLSAMACLI